MNLHSQINAALGSSLFVIATIFFSAPFAYASDATIFLSPITGTYTTGSSFTLSVMVSSGGDTVNAVEGKLEYDAKEISVDAVDKTSSVLNSWTIEPTPNNESGELSFAGSLATGTPLDRSIVLKFSAHLLRSGELHIRFATGAAVHAADGTGGNILTALKGGVYVTEPAQTDPQIPTGIVAENNGASLRSGEVLGAATGTVITSTTHPDPTLWYATSTAILDWAIPAGTESILVALNKHPKGDGTNAYSPDTHKKIIRDIKDGVWYFHLTRVMASGDRVTDSYRVAVDTVAPSVITVSEVTRKDASVPNVGIQLFASDTTSGVDHYAFQLDQAGEGAWVDDGSHIKTFQTLAAGIHQLAVTAVDKAGNRAAGHVEFTVENLPTPVITVMNSTFIEGDKLKLSVTSVPSATLDIHVAHVNSSPATEEYTVDDKGKGIFESALPLSPGSFTVSAIAHTSNGALSKESERASFDVNSSFLGVTKRHPMIPVAIIGFFFLLLVGWYMWRNMFSGNDDDMQNDADGYTGDEVSRDITPRKVTKDQSKEVPREREMSQGAVVLTKKKAPEMPSTRL